MIKIDNNTWGMISIVWIVPQNTSNTKEVIQGFSSCDKDVSCVFLKILY